MSQKNISIEITVYKKDEKKNEIFLYTYSDMENVKKETKEYLENFIIHNNLMTTHSGTFAIVKLDEIPLLLVTYKPSFNYHFYTKSADIENEIQEIAPGLGI